MDFEFSEQQRLLQQSVERLFSEQYDARQRKHYLTEQRGWSPSLWQRYADLGLLAMPFAEKHGGTGGGTVETMIVMEAFGKHLVLEPYLATVVLCGGFLRLAGSAEQCRRLLPRIADGKLLMAFAQAESQSRYNLSNVVTTARRTDDGWVLNGGKRYVLHGDCADELIVSARTAGDHQSREGIGLFIVDAGQQGVSRRSYLMQDRLRAADVNLDNVKVADDAVIGEPGKALPLIEFVVDTGIAALCAEAVGAMEKVHELTVEYLKTRKQFGVTIGSFQALQHRAVDMLVMIEQARSMAYLASVMAEEVDAKKRRPAISAAKVQIGKSGKFVGQQAIQLHGGVGMTEEYQVGHYFRRLSMIEILFGDTGHHLAAVADSGSLLQAW